MKMKLAMLLALSVAAINLRAGSIARLTYDGITGTTVAALTNSTAFPDQPTFREQLDDFLPSVSGKPLFGLQSKENNGNNFGSYARGYLEAPLTGSYVFYIASDDSSELRLSTDYNDANRQRIAFESASGAALFSSDRLSERRSTPISLVRGQKYYIEVLHKQGTGASFIQIGWQRPDGVQEIIPALHLAQHPLDAFLGRAEPNLPPTFNPSGLNAGDLPIAVSATEGDDVILQLDVIAAQPTTFAWKENGVEIPGENLSFLRLPRIALSRDGHTFQATVANAFGELTTTLATVSVAPDITRPTLTNVQHFDNSNQLYLTFSGPIAAVTNSNFQLKGPDDVSIPISSIALTNSEHSVILSGNLHLQPGSQYTLTVQDIHDLARIPNLLDPNPTIHPFVFDPDLTPPRVTSIQGAPTEVKISFDEALDAASGTDTNHYSIENLTVTSASLDPDGKTITLKTSAQTVNTIYLISIRGVKDASVTGNILNTLASFKSELTYASEVLADSPVRYWQFNETAGPLTTVAASIDPLSTGNIPVTSGVVLLAPPLIPSDANGSALALDGSTALIVPNGSDLNAVAGPWAKRTVEFWFNATSVPLPGSAGLAATAGLWEQGAATRSISAYLWRDPANENTDEALLTFHAFNSTSDGAGSPFGITGAPAIIVQYPVKAGVTYHVAGVFDGDATGVTGNLILYINGIEVGRAPGIGQIYNHTGDIQIGRGNGVIHTGQNGNFGVLNGTIDDISYFNKALTSARIAAHYKAGLGVTNSSGATLSIARIETRGNPSQVLVTFDRPIKNPAAIVASNFDLKTSSGSPLQINSATLLPGNLTVQLLGAFNLELGSTYELSARGVADAAIIQSFIFNEAGAPGIGAGSDLNDRTIAENATTTFKIVATGVAPFVYQWFHNGIAIGSATQPTLTVVATPENAGDYTVRVSNELSDLTATPAHLTVNLDTAAPSIVSIAGFAGSLNEVRVAFNEPLDLSSATNQANFTLGSTSVLSSTLSSDWRSVVLKTSGLIAAQQYQLSVSNLKDRASAHNSLTTLTNFTATISYSAEILSESPVRYWRFNETNGTKAASLATVIDSPTVATATLVNAPELGVASLAPNSPGDTALHLRASSTNYVTVPTGSDLNANVGPWSKRTIDFFFRADSLPAIGSTGLASTAGLYEEGGANRGIALYLWRDPNNVNSNQAELIFHAVNNLSDGVGSPFGLPGGVATYIQHTVFSGKSYHVTAVFDGDASGLNGNLILYLDGAEVARGGGIGQVYNHTSDIQIGRGNALTHLNLSGVLGSFDGVLDEFSIFNKALPGERIEQLNAFANAAIAPAIAFKSVRITTQGIALEWDGNAILEGSETVDGHYLTIEGANSPFAINGSGGARFFRLRNLP